jgi:hypothetical protein
MCGKSSERAEKVTKTKLHQRQAEPVGDRQAKIAAAESNCYPIPVLLDPASRDMLWEARLRVTSAPLERKGTAFVVVSHGRGSQNPQH